MALVLRPLALFIAFVCIGIAFPLAAQDDDYQLDLTDASGPVGSVVTIDVTYLGAAEEIAGYEFDVCDDALIDNGFGDVFLGPALELVEFSTHTVSYETDGFSVAAILEPGYSLLPGEPLVLYEIDYELLELGLSEPYFCGTFLPPLVTTVGGVDIEPATGAGAISIVVGATFLRGDANGNGVVEPLHDADFLMQFLFLGTTFPPCLDAADADNNGVVSIADPIVLLTWGFVGGPAPAAPGATVCGTDPEGGDLGCSATPDPCPGVPPDPSADPLITFTISTPVDPVQVDDDVVLSVTLANDSVPLAGYQFGVCHGSGLVLADLGIESPIAPGADTFGGTVFFEATQLFGDGWTAAGYMNPIIGDEIGFGTFEIYLATYTVIEEGFTAVEICDTLGDPAIPARVLSDGELLLPATASGGVTGSPDLPDFELHLSDGAGLAGGTAAITVSITHEGDPIEGWHWGVCHDPLVSIEAGDIVNGAETAGLAFLFQSIEIVDGGWTVDALLTPADALAAGTDLEMYIATYSLDGGGVAALSFCDTLGTPPVPVGWVVGGAEFAPATFGGSITSDSTTVFRFAVDAPPVAYDPEDVPASVAFTANLSIEEDPLSVGFPSDTEAFSMGIAHAAAAATVVTASFAPLITTLNGGAGPDFESINLAPSFGADSGVTVAAVYSFVGPVFLEFDVPKAVVGVDYVLVDPTVLEGNLDGSSVALDWSNDLGTPPVENTVVVGSTSYSPLLVDGTVAFVPGGLSFFLRGDCSGDGVFNALLDALFLLNYQFNAGPTPPCFDAADANGDDVVNALLDALHILNYQFNQGPAPPAPGPSVCGPEPDPSGTTTCETPPAACN